MMLYRFRRLDIYYCAPDYYWPPDAVSRPATLPVARHHCRGNCDVDADLPPVEADAPRAPRASDWFLGVLSLGGAAILASAKLRSRFERLT